MARKNRRKQVNNFSTIAEANNFIILDHSKDWQIADSYQSESDLESANLFTFEIKV